MTDQLLQSEEHRRADGTRPLELGRPARTIAPAYVDPQVGRELECYVVRQSAIHDRPVPARCRVRIVAGDHYLERVGQDGAGNPLDYTIAYCAPCAIHEWAAWGVRECTP